MSDDPNDEPEGTAFVLVSVTLFKQLIRDTGGGVIEWGNPQRYEVVAYTPSVKDEDQK